MTSTHRMYRTTQVVSLCKGNICSLRYFENDWADIWPLVCVCVWGETVAKHSRHWPWPAQQLEGFCHLRMNRNDGVLSFSVAFRLFPVWFSLPSFLQLLQKQKSSLNSVIIFLLTMTFKASVSRISSIFKKQRLDPWKIPPSVLHRSVTLFTAPRTITG